MYRISARGLIILAAAAAMPVGFVPADLDENRHVLGALFNTFFGNTGPLLAGRAMRTSQPRPIRLLAPIVGGVGLLATLLFFSGHYFGLGMGGMERFAIFNLPVWTLAVGCYVLVSGAA